MWAALLATLGAGPLAAQSPAGEDSVSLEGRARAFFHQVREESRPGAAAPLGHRGHAPSSLVPVRRGRGAAPPTREPASSPTFVEWRREDGRWVVSAFGDESGRVHEVPER